MNPEEVEEIEFTVRGAPKAQGSMRAFVIKGRPIITSTSKSLHTWRQLVALRAQDLNVTFPPKVPLKVSMVLYLPKPKSAPKKRRTWAVNRPDLDKLVRAMLDAITHVLINDDDQVVHIDAKKDYGPPGVEIRIERILPESAEGMRFPESCLQKVSGRKK